MVTNLPSISPTLRNHKTSHRVYICATGNSVNRLSPAILEDIQKHNSIGINLWTLHHLIPTFYVMEANKSHMDIVSPLLRKSMQYSDTQVIIKPCEGGEALSPKDLPHNMRFCTSHDYLIPGSTRQDISRHLRNTQKLHDDFSKGIMPKRRGTAVYCIILAWLLGYTEVVLVGVDITTSQHFYEPTPAQEQKHLCEDPKIGIPISQVILGAKDALFSDGIHTLKAVFPSPAFRGELQEHTIGG